MSAFECDMKSAFGGIVAFNETIDEKAAIEVIKLFTEAVIAPDVTDAAKRVFRKKMGMG